MYGAVTSLTEKVGGAQWEELVDRELYKPLGMNKSGFATSMDFNRSVAAKPLHFKREAVYNLDFPHPMFRTLLQCCSYMF